MVVELATKLTTQFKLDELSSKFLLPINTCFKIEQTQVFIQKPVNRTLAIYTGIGSNFDNVHISLPYVVFTRRFRRNVSIYFCKTHPTIKSPLMTPCFGHVYGDGDGMCLDNLNGATTDFEKIINYFWSSAFTALYFNIGGKNKEMVRTQTHYDQIKNKIILNNKKFRPIVSVSTGELWTPGTGYSTFGKSTKSSSFET